MNTDQRMSALRAAYETSFNSKSTSAARAPGRTNLIGEHTDYNSCPVFPMAVNRDIMAVFAPRKDDKIVITDLVTEYGSREFQIAKEIPPFEAGNWGNYPKAAVQGLLDFFAQTESAKAESFHGFNAIIHSTVPPAGGMSSSSAFVVLAALIFLEANGRKMEKQQLAGLMSVAERYVGTQGGGMDQAASLLGKEGFALKIDFNPLRVLTVPVPAGHAVVVANTMIKAPKSQSALKNYNRRPIECRLAAAILKKGFENKYGKEMPIGYIGDLTTEKLGLPDAEIRATADKLIHQKPYTMSGIASVLGMSEHDVEQRWCKNRDGSIFEQPEDGFKLYLRYRHVMTEWKRVEDSVVALNQSDIKEFGRLMFESHDSCRDNHEVSCKELDALVEISRNAGALGARMTGAGFGGCTVSLVKDADVDSFIAKIRKEYYQVYLPSIGVTPDEESIDDSIFPALPSEGAGIIQ